MVDRGPVTSEKVRLADKLALFSELWSPRTIADLNNYRVKLVKVKGDFTWHDHEDTDEFFLVLAGRLQIRLRDREITLEVGELFIVPRGVEHCPFAEEETHILLIEPAGVLNTGDAASELTAQDERI